MKNPGPARPGRLSWLAGTAAVLLPAIGLASAFVNPPPNTLGLYFDAGAMLTRGSIQVGEPFTVYLVLHRPDPELEIAGWEARVETDATPAPVLVGADYGPGTTYGIPPDHVVATCLPGCLDPAEDVTLAALTFVSQAVAEFDFVLAPVTAPMVQDRLGFLAGDDLGSPHDMTPLSAYTDAAVASTRPDHVEPPATLHVDVEPDLTVPDTVWRVLGPNGFDRTGGPDQSLDGLWAGSYTVRWLETDNYRPSGPDSLVVSVGFGEEAFATGGFVRKTSGLGVPDRPERTALIGAMPNPFNALTTVVYDLAEDATVELTVYDARGRVVRVLLAGDRQGAGRQRTPWDGRDDDGSPVAAGVYVYRLRAGPIEAVGRLALVK